MSRQDCKFVYLRGAGFTGAINDMEHQYLVAQGAPDGHINDMWMFIWTAGGGTPAAFNDMAYEFLGGFGLTGALADMWETFWCNFASGVPTNYSVAWDADTYDFLTAGTASATLTFDVAYAGFTYNMVVSGLGSADIPLTGTLDGTGTLTVVADLTVFTPGTVFIVVTITSGVITGLEKTDTCGYSYRTPVLDADFSTYPDATYLEAHADWQHLGGISSSLLITRNLLRNNVSGDGIVGLVAQPPDMTEFAIGAKLSYKATGSVSSFPLCIALDIDNMIGIRIFNSQIHLYTRIGGSWAQPIQLYWPTQIGDTLTAVVTGGNILVYHNGNLVFTWLISIDISSWFPAIYGRTTAVDLMTSYLVWDMTDAGPPLYP